MSVTSVLSSVETDDGFTVVPRRSPRNHRQVPEVSLDENLSQLTTISLPSRLTAPHASLYRSTSQPATSAPTPIRQRGRIKAPKASTTSNTRSTNGSRRTRALVPEPTVDVLLAELANPQPMHIRRRMVASEAGRLLSAPPASLTLLAAPSGIRSMLPEATLDPSVPAPSSTTVLGPASLLTAAMGTTPANLNAPDESDTTSTSSASTLASYLIDEPTLGNLQPEWRAVEDFPMHLLGRHQLLTIKKLQFFGADLEPILSQIMQNVSNSLPDADPARFNGHKLDLLLKLSLLFVPMLLRFNASINILKPRIRLFQRREWAVLLSDLRKDLTQPAVVATDIKKKYKPVISDPNSLDRRYRRALSHITEDDDISKT